MRRIAMFGGTFNPPHVGHVAAARACVQQLALNKLIVMPTNIPPHKILPEGSATPQQRLEMAAIAASLIPMAEVSALEIERKGASYTFETIRTLKSLYPDSTLWLVVGTDMLATFDHWRRPEDIVACARLAAVARSDEDRAFIDRRAEELRRSLDAQVDIVYNRAVEVSSTDFRSGKAPNLVPSDVLRYIRAHGLYGYGE